MRVRIPQNTRLRSLEQGDECLICTSELITESKYIYTMSQMRTVLIRTIPLVSDKNPHENDVEENYDPIQMIIFLIIKELIALSI